jgi:hypothetical protein
MRAFDPDPRFQRKLPCKLVREGVMSKIRRKQFLVTIGAQFAASLGVQAGVCDMAWNGDKTC